MKTARTYLFFTALLFFLPSCQAPRVHDRKVVAGAERLGITPEQYLRYKKYLVYRDRFTTFLNLPAQSTPEEIRSRVAGRLELPKDSTWETLLSEKMVASYLTDERRKKFAAMFGLPPETSWVALMNYLEGLRARGK
jgi:hypothetical protein